VLALRIFLTLAALHSLIAVAWADPCIDAINQFNAAAKRFNDTLAGRSLGTSSEEQCRTTITAIESILPILEEQNTLLTRMRSACGSRARDMRTGVNPGDQIPKLTQAMQGCKDALKEAEETRQAEEAKQREAAARRAQPATQQAQSPASMSPQPSFACPTQSTSDITGLPGETSSSSTPSPSTCQYPSGPNGASNIFNTSTNTTVKYPRWDGTIIEIPPGFGLWLQDGELQVQKVDATHPADARPSTHGDDNGCAANIAYGTDSPVGTGWVSLGCQLQRERNRYDRYVQDHYICEDACKRRGRIIYPNRNANVLSPEACTASGGTALVTVSETDDLDIVQNAGWLPDTRWCVVNASTKPAKIKDAAFPEKVCRTEDGVYRALLNADDKRCDSSR
jgi:hypothetical protein